MGYAHIANLYRPEAHNIFLFKECFALEKICGTPAHIRWKNGVLSFFSGGENNTRFVSLFNQPRLAELLLPFPVKEITLYGAAYGGKQQGMEKVYGPKLRFAVFDVKLEDTWLSVPNAENVTNRLGLSFVPYRRIATELALLDAERDAPSEQSIRNGLEDACIYDSSKREGIVIHPILEFTLYGETRIRAKHKRPGFREHT